jgi:ABC-type uncharacterized transport system fused permease/ATPase subunit
MKNFIVSILEPILSLFVVIYTLFGFVAGGLLGTFGLFGGDFNLIGGFVFFLIAVIGTGAIFTLLTIKDLLEEQVRLLRRSN